MMATTSEGLQSTLAALPKTEIPPNATIRREPIRCGKRNCSKCPHGGYLYAYWRQGGKLHKKYIGKEIEHYNERFLASRMGLSVDGMMKMFDEADAKRKAGTAAVT